MEARRVKRDCRGIFIATWAHMGNLKRFSMVVPDVDAAATHCRNQLLAQTDIHPGNISGMEHGVQVLHLRSLKSSFFTVVRKLSSLQLVVSIDCEQCIFWFAQTNRSNAVGSGLMNYALLVDSNLRLEERVRNPVVERGFFLIGPNKAVRASHNQAATCRIYAFQVVAEGGIS